jgi:hypothetical protein
MTTALIGASLTGTATYFGCLTFAKLDANTSTMAAGAAAVLVGGVLMMQKTEGNEEMSAQEKEWEEQLKAGGGLDDLGTDAPDAPKVPENKQLNMSHPLGGQPVKIDNNTGCIDF